MPNLVASELGRLMDVVSDSGVKSLGYLEIRLLPFCRFIMIFVSCKGDQICFA